MRKPPWAAPERRWRIRGTGSPAAGAATQHSSRRPCWGAATAAPSSLYLPGAHCADPSRGYGRLLRRQRHHAVMTAAISERADLFPARCGSVLPAANLRSIMAALRYPVAVGIAVARTAVTANDVSVEVQALLHMCRHAGL